MPRSDSNVLAEQCTALHIRGPLLIVASSRTVSELAPSWETALRPLNISYHELDEILKEALDFLATALAVIGTQDILKVARLAASQSDLQLISVLYEPQ